jgi:hypothetical protein
VANRCSGQERHRSHQRSEDGSSVTESIVSCLTRNHGLTREETGQRLQGLVHPSSVSGVPSLHQYRKTSIPSLELGGLFFCYLAESGRSGVYVYVPNGTITLYLNLMKYQQVMNSASGAISAICAEQNKLRRVIAHSVMKANVKWCNLLVW